MLWFAPPQKLILDLALPYNPHNRPFLHATLLVPSGTVTQEETAHHSTAKELGRELS